MVDKAGYWVGFTISSNLIQSNLTYNLLIIDFIHHLINNTEERQSSIDYILLEDKSHKCAYENTYKIIYTYFLFCDCYFIKKFIIPQDFLS